MSTRNATLSNPFLNYTFPSYKYPIYNYPYFNLSTNYSNLFNYNYTFPAYSLPTYIDPSILISNVTYISVGVGAIFVNAIILLAILGHKHLRQRQYAFICIIALIEGLTGAAMVGFGVYQLNIFNNVWFYYTLYNLLECLYTSPVPFFFVSVVAVGLTHILCAADRLLAVTLIVFYRTVSAKRYYGFMFGLLTALILLFTMCMAVVFWYTPGKGTCDKIGMQVRSKLVLVVDWFRVCSGYASVGIYTVVIGVLWYRAKSKFGAVRKYVREQQKLTLSFAAVIFLKCLLYSLPINVNLVINNALYGAYSGAISALSFMIDIVIYSVRQKELRWAFLNVISFGIYKKYNQVRHTTVHFSPWSKSGRRSENILMESTLRKE